MKLFKAIQEKVSKKFFVACFAVFMLVSAAVPAMAAPATGDTDLDAMLTNLETKFAVIKTGFWYLALAAIPVTVAVLIFFWLRGKFKQSVQGA